MPDDDLRKWTTSKCAKEIREIQARLDGAPIDNGSPRSPGSQGLHPGSPGNTTFEAWCESSILSLVTSEGWGVCNWDQVADTVQNLAAAWAVVLAARNASDEELLAFFDHADHLHKKMDNWLAVKKRHILSKSKHSLPLDQIAPEPTAPAPVFTGDRNAMPTEISAEELATEEAAYAADGGV